jgi:hypothetical protein
MSHGAPLNINGTLKARNDLQTRQLDYDWFIHLKELAHFSI